MSTIVKKRGELIEQGTKVIAQNGSEIKINYLINDTGGQGDVYHVTYNAHDYALKWYCKHLEDVIGGSQYRTITKIYGEEKRPDEEFIWPLILGTEENPADGKRFGYLMELLPKGFYKMEDFLRKDTDPGQVKFNSYNSLLVAGMNIAAAMQKLHLRGLSYKDLNPKNFSINPENGDVLVVDNDNVSVDGDPCSVKGMKGYMAPEIPRSNYNNNPTTKTDYYSLAIVLYRLFYIDHPMEGKAWEKYPMHPDKVEEYLYAINPVFHFDPSKDSNRPTDGFAPNALARWRAIPNVELRNLFIRAFTEGIDNPKKRPPEIEWITTIARARDKLIRINPQQEQFVNFSDPRSIPQRCLGLRIGNNKIAIYPQKAIYQISIDGNVKEYGTIVAGITYNKQIGKMCIRNLSNKVWRAYNPTTKQVTDVGKSQEFPLFPGVMIEFHRDQPKIVGEIFDPKA